MVPEEYAGKGLKWPPAASDKGTWERPQVVGGRGDVWPFSRATSLTRAHSCARLHMGGGVAELPLGYTVKIPIFMKPELEACLSHLLAKPGPPNVTQCALVKKRSGLGWGRRHESVKRPL